MLKDYLNQSCGLEKKTGDDQRGQPVYAAAITIACRLVGKYQLIRKPNGETVPVHHICYTTETVAAGDKINGSFVHAVDVWTDLGGEPIGYKAVL